MRSMKDIYDDLDFRSNLHCCHSNLPHLKKQSEMRIGCKKMDEEIEAIEKNDTWDFVDLPKNKNLIGVN